MCHKSHCLKIKQNLSSKAFLNTILCSFRQNQKLSDNKAASPCLQIPFNCDTFRDGLAFCTNAQLSVNIPNNSRETPLCNRSGEDIFHDRRAINIGTETFSWSGRGWDVVSNKGTNWGQKMSAFWERERVGKFPGHSIFERGLPSQEYFTGEGFIWLVKQGC